jgi:hypothetical protein
MALPNPTRDEVRTILAAAADVLFSDGVSDAFLDHWVEESLFMLSRRSAPVAEVSRVQERDRV